MQTLNHLQRRLRDNNPLHLNDEFAISSKFGVRFFESLMCNQITGHGSVYVSQNLRFKKPVYLGDTVVAEVIESLINAAQRRVF